jgi:hypothetical protein
MLIYPVKLVTDEYVLLALVAAFVEAPASWSIGLASTIQTSAVFFVGVDMF